MYHIPFLRKMIISFDAMDVSHRMDMDKNPAKKSSPIPSSIVLVGPRNSHSVSAFVGAKHGESFPNGNGMIKLDEECYFFFDGVKRMVKPPEKKQAGFCSLNRLDPPRFFPIEL